MVGVLQLDVLAARAKQEYRVEIVFEDTPFAVARWLRAENEKSLDDFVKAHPSSVVLDRDDKPVFLARNDWDLDHTQRNNESIEFLKTKELE